MAEVFAGFVCGYAVAVVSAPLLALYLLRWRASGSAILERLMPPGTPVLALVVVLHGGLFVAWTGAGILLGMLLYAMRDAGSALGSANAPFTLFVAAVVLALFAPPLLALPRLRPVLLPMALAAVAVFGWLMPHMASWTKFGSS